MTATPLRPSPTISMAVIREAQEEAGWDTGTMAQHLGMGRNVLFRLYRDGGDLPERYTRGTETLDRARAEARRAHYEADRVASELGVWRVEVDDWARAYAAQKPNLSQATIRGYVRHLGWLATSVAAQHPDPWHLPTHVLQAWLDGRNWSSDTRRKVIVSLRAFYAWGVLRGHCQHSPLSGIQGAADQGPGGPVRSIPGPRRRDISVEMPAAWRAPVLRYLDSLRAGGLAPSTIDQARHRLWSLAELHHDPAKVTREHLERWLSRPDWSPSTRRGALRWARAFYGWMVEVDLISAKANPTRALRSIRVPRAMPRPAPDDVVLQGLALADHRTYLAILLGAYAGLRRSEIAGIHSRDVGDDAVLIRGKGGHERLVPLHPELAATLGTELARRRNRGPLRSGWGEVVPPEDTWLFPSSHGGHLSAAYLAKRVTAALGDAGWTTHTLRHRFATQAYRATRDIRAVQELLGHTKPETTAIYAATSSEAARAAVAAVPVVGEGRTARANSVLRAVD